MKCGCLVSNIHAKKKNVKIITLWLIRIFIYLNLEIDAVQGAKKKEKERKRKQNVPIVGDLTPMEDALPTLELLLKKSTESASSRFASSLFDMWMLLIFAH